jgi:hypothetical protein
LNAAKPAPPSTDDVTEKAKVSDETKSTKPKPKPSQKKKKKVEDDPFASASEDGEEDAGKTKRGNVEHGEDETEQDGERPKKKQKA